MTNKFKNKYRTQTTRWRHWDYGWNAAYFVTICTKNRECWFGKVANGKMILNDIGKIAHDCWLHIPHHFPFVQLGDHVIMPNHVHGIIIIDKPDDGHMDDHDMVEAQNFAPLQQPQQPQQQQQQQQQQRPPPQQQRPPQQQPHPKPPSTTKNRFGPQSKNLASIIRGFKIGVTKHARLINPDFAWQSRYHDHVIRDDASHQRIARYIQNNPAQWQEDSFHPKKPNADKKGSK
ncbi:MAG: hypothetical protein KatS3mg031_1359 [Chitinophagales bacterium]|nr:MAG: hypothetical protein KatS3mg031_1359 [Chitinophagales bacterium]